MARKECSPRKARKSPGKINDPGNDTGQGGALFGVIENKFQKNFKNKKKIFLDTESVLVERHLNITRDEPLKIVTDTEEENETDREGENFDERKKGLFIWAARTAAVLTQAE